MIEKKAYFNSFNEHVEKCIECSERIAKEKLPGKIKCLLGVPDLYEKALSDGYIKYFGGRMLSPEKMINLSVYDAARFTFVDGEIPTWINLYYEGYDEEYSYVRILTSKTISGDASKLYNMPEGGKQFRVFVSGLGVDGHGLPENLQRLPGEEE